VLVLVDWKQSVFMSASSNYEGGRVHLDPNNPGCIMSNGSGGVVGIPERAVLARLKRRLKGIEMVRKLLLFYA
jgi:hypothetical protein